MLRHLKQGILSASTIILSKDIDNYAYKCSSNFYESDVKYNVRLFGLPFPYKFWTPLPLQVLTQYSNGPLLYRSLLLSKRVSVLNNFSKISM